MEKMGVDFFACSTFAKNPDGNVRAGNLQDHGIEGFHGCAGPENEPGFDSKLRDTVKLMHFHSLNSSAASVG